ncbi:hypothetical protein J6590_020227 [Homalodisca vitripennis]|nr:hypothetical protein J6590_020227 [Homalodisca vitripennis]
MNGNAVLRNRRLPKCSGNEFSHFFTLKRDMKGAEALSSQHTQRSDSCGSQRVTSRHPEAWCARDNP